MDIKISPDKEPILRTVLKGSPEVFRMLADRLEQKKAIALPGQIVRLAVGGDYEVEWDPEVTFMQHVKRLNLPEQVDPPTQDPPALTQ